MENKLEAVQDLHDWSFNCIDFRPWTVFLDLIGWKLSATAMKRLADWHNPSVYLGYLELDYLGAALRCYAKYPNEVNDLVYELCNKDIEEGNFAKTIK